MKNNIFYVLLNNKNYEFLNDNGECETDVLLAERFEEEKLAWQEHEVLDEPDSYDVVKVSLMYVLEKMT